MLDSGATARPHARRGRLPGHLRRVRQGAPGGPDQGPRGARLRPARGDRRQRGGARAAARRQSMRCWCPPADPRRLAAAVERLGDERLRAALGAAALATLPPGAHPGSRRRPTACERSRDRRDSVGGQRREPAPVRRRRTRRCASPSTSCWSPRSSSSRSPWPRSWDDVQAYEWTLHPAMARRVAGRLARLLRHAGAGGGRLLLAGVPRPGPLGVVDVGTVDPRPLRAGQRLHVPRQGAGEPAARSRGAALQRRHGVRAGARLLRGARDPRPALPLLGVPARV